MLDLGRYLLGAFEVALLVGFAWLGASRVRARLLPRFEGAPAHLATTVIALALLLWVAELLGSFAVFEAFPYLLTVIAIGLTLRFGIAGSDVPPAGGAVAGVPPGAGGAERPSPGGGGAATGPAA